MVDDTAPNEKKPADDSTPDLKPEPPPHYEEDSIERESSVTIGGVEIPYTSTAGRVILREEDGKKKASFFFTAYTRSDVDDAAGRPITFAFNGGPGSASVWLHMGAFGPRRVELDDDGFPPSLPGRLVPNDESILDATDLVFIDPVGTGFSRAIPRDEAKNYHHFSKDIESVGDFIHLYLSRHGRWASPKFLAGESYGTTRAAGLAAALLDQRGIAFNGLVLVSAILNFLTAPFDMKTFTFAAGNDLPYAVFLPTYAAAAWFHGKVAEQHRDRPIREFLDEVEGWVRTEYVPALFLGEGLTGDDYDRVATRLAEYTGLPRDYLDRYRLRIEILRFCKALRREEGLTIGRLDARYTGEDRFPDGDSIEADPAGDAFAGQYAALFNHYVRTELGYESDLPYQVLSLEVHQAWDYDDFKNAVVDTSEGLRATMARNRHQRVLVANGYFDLATPHFATEYTLDHMRLTPSQRDRVEMTYYQAGHMMYAHRPSHRDLSADIRRFIAGAV